MTQYIELTETPVKLPAGGKGIHLTVEKGGNPRYAIGVNAPVNTSAYHVLRENTCSIEAGVSVWMWTANGAFSTAITVSPLN